MGGAPAEEGETAGDRGSSVVLQASADRSQFNVGKGTN